MLSSQHWFVRGITHSSLLHTTPDSVESVGTIRSLMICKYIEGRFISAKDSFILLMPHACLNRIQIILFKFQTLSIRDNYFPHSTILICTGMFKWITKKKKKKKNRRSNLLVNYRKLPKGNHGCLNYIEL